VAAKRTSASIAGIASRRFREGFAPPALTTKITPRHGTLLRTPERRRCCGSDTNKRLTFAPLIHKTAVRMNVEVRRLQDTLQAISARCMATICTLLDEAPPSQPAGGRVSFDQI
jgi:hypothetical protein